MTSGLEVLVYVWHQHFNCMWLHEILFSIGVPLRDSILIHLKQPQASFVKLLLYLHTDIICQLHDNNFLGLHWIEHNVLDSIPAFFLGTNIWNGQSSWMSRSSARLDHPNRRRDFHTMLWTFLPAGNSLESVSAWLSILLHFAILRIRIQLSSITSMWEFPTVRKW